MKAALRPARSAEHEFEAQWGLPEALPADEHILWQGQPRVAAIARRVFHLPALAIYFAVLLVWRIAVLLENGQPLRDALGMALLFATALAIVFTLAWLTARTTAYTLTDHRVVMRVGIVLTVTYNLPLRRIDAAHVARQAGGSGEIALALRGPVRIAYLHLWPHARPWHLRQPQPMLRGLAEVDGVANQLSAAWAQANAVPAVPASEPAAPARPDRRPQHAVA